MAKRYGREINPNSIYYFENSEEFKDFLISYVTDFNSSQWLQGAFIAGRQEPFSEQTKYYIGLADSADHRIAIRRHYTDAGRLQALLVPRKGKIKGHGLKVLPYFYKVTRKSVKIS